MPANRPDFMVWDPIPDRSTQPNIVERMTIHTAWVDAPDIYGPQRGQGDTYAHCYNPTTGQMRQHQELDRKAYADLDGNGRTVSVEHQDERRDMPLSESQIDNDARLFAHLVTHYGTPNRIATVDDTRGLAWHRLGCAGNFGPYHPADLTTWSAAQTGERWTTVYGKTCPTNPRIRQIPEIWLRAQEYINPTPTEEDDMFTDADRAKVDQTFYAIDKLLLPAAKATREQVYALRTQTVPVLEGQVRGLSLALSAVAAGQPVDLDAVMQAAREGAGDGVAEALAAVQADVTVTVKKEA